MIDRLRLRQLRYFVEVARNGSIGKAAEVFNVSQPAITSQIKELEKTLGVTLFTRSRSGVALTPYGDIFLQSSTAIVDELNEAAARLEAFKHSGKGHVSIGGAQLGTSRVVPLAVARLKARRPFVTVTLVVGAHEHLLAALKAGQLDLVFGRRGDPNQMSGLAYEVLFEERLVLVARARHPLAGRRGLALSDLLDFPWIVPLPNATLRRRLEEIVRAGGLAFPRNYVESVVGAATQTYIAETDAVAALPDKIFEDDLRTGKLVKLVDLESPLGDVGITRRESAALAPPARMLIQELRRVGARFRDERRSRRR
jgi:DNA-binding transcriptional LysR family regulator